MSKHYLSANELLLDSFKLAEKIYLSGFKPDFVIGIWRGGAPVGIAVHEYLDYTGLNTRYLSIGASSYQGIEEQASQVQLFGVEPLIEQLTATQKILLVDDVFDSGQTIQAILERLNSELKNNISGQIKSEIKIATPWYKPTKNTSNITPDFYLHETEKWLVFPHELKGLSLEEITTKKGDIVDVLPRHLASS